MSEVGECYKGIGEGEYDPIRWETQAKNKMIALDRHINNFYRGDENDVFSLYFMIQLIFGILSIILERTIRDGKR